MKNIKYLIVYIIISFSMFCLEQEENMLKEIKNIKETNQNTYNTFYKTISEEAIMNNFKELNDEKMEKDLRKTYFIVLNRYNDKAFSIDKYYKISNSDFEEAILLLEKAIYLKRNLDTIESKQFVSYYDDGSFYSHKLMSETMDFIEAFSNELMTAMLNQIMKDPSVQGISDDEVKTTVK